MLKRKFLVTFAALMFLVTGVSNVNAQTTQEGLSLGPSARPFGSTDETIFDTDLYEYDAQLWAPYDITSPDGSQKLQSGFYAELGFGYHSIDRPGESAGGPGQDPRVFNSGSDWAWAREIELGYMSEKDRGWSIAWQDLEGSVFVNGEDIIINQPTLIRTTFDKVELNRQFRQRLSGGGWVEPFIGLRYTQLTDHTNEDGVLGTTSDVRFGQRVNNSAVGAHVGTRYFRRYGRFRVGGDVALGAMYNDQRYYAFTYVLNRNTGIFTYVENTNNSNDLLPIADFGLRLDYMLTRDISFRVAGGLQYAWDGLARADLRTTAINPNSGLSAVPFPNEIFADDLVVAGFSFGIDWRR